LQSRNDNISNFWQSPTEERGQPQEELKGLRVLVLDAEDTFTTMICHQLSAFSLSVDVANAKHPIPYDNYDIFVLGPGPGDPNNLEDARVYSLHNAVKTLIKQKRPFLAVCLSHQILCTQLGLQVQRKDMPNQGTQKEIDLFGQPERVGFYNTFAAMMNDSTLRYDGVTLEVSRDPHSGEVHALRGPLFASFQFHPESILTQNGAQLLGTVIGNLLK